MNPSDLIQAFFLLFVVAPVVAAILAFKAPPAIRTLARVILLLSFLANGAATIACLRAGFARPSSGIGNGVFLLIAIPFAVFTIVWFAFWRGARRHAWVQSLPPAERQYEELVDIERGLEAATQSLARTERKLKEWLLGSDERERLEFERDMLQMSIAKLEEERAKRR